MTGDKPRIELSAVQVVGGALAAASAAVAASLLGVGGTVVGAIVASIVTTVGSAMYTHSMRRGRYALQQARTAHLTQLHRLPARKVGPAEGAEAAKPAETEKTGEQGEKSEPNDPEDAGNGDSGGDATARQGWRDRLRALDARTVAITAACALVLALGVITGVEALIGKPISSALDGGKQRGTSIGSLAQGNHRPSTGTTRTPSRSATPTPTATETVTRSPSQTPTRLPLRPSQTAPASTPTSTGGTSHAPTPSPSTSLGSATHSAPGGLVP